MGWLSAEASWNAAKSASVMVREGIGNRSPTVRSSNQRGAASRCSSGLKAGSGMARAGLPSARRRRGGGGGGRGGRDAPGQQRDEEGGGAGSASHGQEQVGEAGRFHGRAQQVHRERADPEGGGPAP